MKKLKAQIDRIGYSFPGVSEDQMAALDGAQDQEQVESPMLEIDSLTIDGEIKLRFNQAMIHPSDINQFDYSMLFKVSLTSATNGRIVQAERIYRRALQDNENPCLGKLLSRMTTEEMMTYYAQLGYNEIDYLAECEVEKKKNPRGQEK